MRTDGFTFSFVLKARAKGKFYNLGGSVEDPSPVAQERAPGSRGVPVRL